MQNNIMGVVSVWNYVKVLTFLILSSILLACYFDGAFVINKVLHFFSYVFPYMEYCMYAFI